MATTVYNPVRVTKKSSKIYHKVTATIRALHLLHADEHTVVLINKIEELALCIQKFNLIIKGKL